MSNSCPQCKKGNPETAISCQQCGAPLAPANAEPGVPGSGKAVKKRGFLSPFALWLYRFLTVLLLLALGYSLIRMFLAEYALSRAQRQLEYARATIEQTVLGIDGGLPKLRLMPPDGQPVELHQKLAGCNVEQIVFEGSRVTLSIANRGLQPTQPFARVLLFDWYGQQVAASDAKDMGDKSLESGGTRDVRFKMDMPRDRPRYFTITDKE